MSQHTQSVYDCMYKMTSSEAPLCYQYVIVCSDKAKNEWPHALVALEDKYSSRWPGQVEVITYPHPDAMVTQCLPRLSHLRPAYACFMVHYKECSRAFVESVHQLCRRIDPSNVYTDTVWGILTGLEEADLLFAINQTDSLTIRRVLAGTPISLANFESGSWYSELKQCESFHKSRDEETVRKEKCPQDTTGILIDELSKKRDIAAEEGVDMMVTSGHATENDWQIGYNYKNGEFITMSSHMMGKAMDGSLHPVTHNGSPKVLSAAGNCLMGHIKTANSMALAWIHSVGVVQMTGYTVSTWYGYMGWGVHDYLISIPGAYSLAESFYANNQSLIAKLKSKYPKHCNGTYESLQGKTEHDCLGLLFDKDSVALYGDPAYDARLVSKPEVHPYQVIVSETGSDDGWSTYQVIVQVATVPKRPVVHLYSSSVKSYRLVETELDDVVVTCRFVLIPIPDSCKGKSYKVVYSVKH